MDFAGIEGTFRPSADRKCSAAEGGMVASAFPLASQAGAAILRRGGNAVDAACCAALALGVCEPQASGLGGESKAIVHLDNHTVAVDGSSRVPVRFDLGQVAAGDLQVGYRGTSVPSTVAVLGYLQRRFGYLKWRDIVEPAIAIAREGYRITPLQHALQARELPLFLRLPSRSAARYFLKEGGEPYDAGELFIQPDLAALLEDLADFGPEFFYKGEPARQIDEDMAANGGFLRAEDLACIPWPVERKPLAARYRGLDVLTVPPPSGGRMLLYALSVLDRFPSAVLSRRDGEVYHLFCEIFKNAVRFETSQAPDPHTYTMEGDFLFSPALIEESIRSLRPLLPVGFPEAVYRAKEGETTHLSVMDGWGNAVGITQSINLVYGSKAAAEGLGFLYNNYLVNMNREDRQHPHYLCPEATSSSFVTPSILFADGRPWMVVGSPGSERIFSTVTQFVSHVLDGKMSICDAIMQPRMHCFLDNRVCFENSRFPFSVIAHLKERGYRLEEKEPWSFYLGAIHAVLQCRIGSGFQGVAEVRRDGSAEGI